MNKFESFNQLEERAEKFFTALDDRQSLALLAAIRDQRQDSRFKVCVVGEFSKGKTHVINGLLNGDILPESSIPTTTMLTEISYGEKSLRFEDSRDKRAYSLDWDKLEDFSADGDKADAEGRLIITYPAPFLKPDLTLYDTPGVDDILSRRADIAYNALESCEAALVAVSAQTPLSMSEQSFLDAYLYNRAIPKIAIVITFLDLIPAQQREKQIAFITSKIKSQYPGVEIWCPLDEADVSVAGFAAMRDRLYKWQHAEDLKLFKSKRDLLRLKNQIDMLVTRQQANIDNLNADLPARRAALNQAYAALDEENEVWRAIHDNLRQKGDLAVETLRNDIDAVEKECRKGIDSEGAQVFASTIRNRLREAGGQMAEMMHRRIEKDKKDTLAEIQERLGVETVSELADLPVDFNLFIREDALAIPDQNGGLIDFIRENTSLFELLRNFGEILTGPVIDLLPLPRPTKMPIKVAAKKAMEALDHWLKSGGPSDKKDALKELVSSFCSQLRMATGDITREIYNNMAKAIRTEQRAWIETQRQALRKAQETDTVKEAIARSQQYIETGSALSKDMAAAVEGN